MRPISTIIALVGFVLISVFGLFLMPYDGSHHDTSCLASIINNSESPCPKDDPLGFANFHNGAVGKILNSIPSFGTTGVAYMSIVAMLIFGLFFLQLFSNQVLSPLAAISELTAVSHPFRLDQRSWFSLHENSPSFR